MRRLVTFLLTISLLGAVAASVAAQSPTPTATDGLFASMVTEEVEPGVFKVVNDGVRDLAKASNTDIVAGRDDGIWLLRPKRFFRLGDGEWMAWATRKPAVSDFEVAPDGTVWTRQTPRGKDDLASIQSFDGEEWTTHRKSWWGGPKVEVTPDGTVWAIWGDGVQEYGDVFGYLDHDGWQVLGDDVVGSLHVASPDSIWGIGSVGNIFSRYLYRFVDGAWQRWIGMEGTEPTWQRAEDPLARDTESFDNVAVGPDGTFWGIATFPDRPNLIRFDGSEWSRWPGRDTFWPTGSRTMGGSTALGVAPDGSVWYATLDEDPSGEPNGWSCGGVRRFDGVTWERYLPNLCVNAIDIAADGSVWVLATDEAAYALDEGFFLKDKTRDRDLYLITPEAVAAVE